MEAPSLWDARPRHERTRSRQSRPASHSQAEPDNLDKPYYGQSGQSPQLSSGQVGAERPFVWWGGSRTVFLTRPPLPSLTTGTIAVAVAAAATHK